MRNSDHAPDPSDTIDEIASQVSNWGRWGDADEIGTVNLIAQSAILAAAQCVRRGAVFHLGLPFDERGPQPAALAGRFNPIHMMLATGTDAIAGTGEPNGFGYSDDAVTMPLQCSTQWDGLSHVFHKGQMYNGFSAALVNSRGAAKNGIERMADGLVGRGVLFDVPRFLGVSAAEPGYAITGDDLDRIAELEDVEIRPGDILLVRTGFMAPFLARGSWRGYDDGDCPGLSHTVATWLHQRDIAAIATDTYRAEVKPTDLPGARSPLHILAITYLGLPLGEMFNLEALSEDCASDGRYEFLLVAAPMPFTGAVGSPVNPIAIK